MFDTSERLLEDKLSLECNNVNDAFSVSESIGNGKLTYPIGLITGDEIVYAGGKYGTSNIEYYLYTNQYWWTMSPSRFFTTYATVEDMYSNGKFDANDVSYSFGIRPVISLASTNKVSSGDGKSTSPYVVA